MYAILHYIIMISGRFPDIWVNLDLLLSIQQFKYFVPETTIAHLDKDTCNVYPGVSYPLSHVYVVQLHQLILLNGMLPTLRELIMR